MDHVLKPTTKKAQTEIKRAKISEAITAAMHILHDSSLFQSKLWPSGGLYAGWPREDNNDTIYIGARIDNDAEPLLIVNLFSKNYDRIYKQMDAIELILSDAIKDDFKFQWLNLPRYISGVGIDYNMGQLKFNF